MLEKSLHFSSFDIHINVSKCGVKDVPGTSLIAPATGTVRNTGASLTTKVQLRREFSENARQTKTHHNPENIIKTTAPAVNCNA